ncbi:MAG: hypothetical protein JXB62_14210 [Pirellulales bacterium]|nr:hypothetical protein [Pirellulales bacterium]
MWCKQCQQDVPGIASADKGEYCCPRCAGRLRKPTGIPLVDGPLASDAATDVESGSSPTTYDRWELDQQLQHIERVLDVGKGHRQRAEAVCEEEKARLDSAHMQPASWHPSVQGEPGHASRSSCSTARPVLAFFSWATLSLGTTAFVCGGILLGWSVVSSREELWAIGMPVTLCGQIALLLGLVLQMDRLWHDSRRASSKLDDVDQQLHELKAATTRLSTSHSSPSSAFYSHLADGAGPDLLLSDLKSQLDLLAMKIGKMQH